MNEENLENEEHVLFSCNLYQKYRIKLINCLNKAFETFINNQPESPLKTESELTLANLKPFLMPLLSPNTPPLLPDEHKATKKASDSIHATENLNQNTSLNESLSNALKYRQSYVINCVNTFILHCSEEKTNFTESRTSENCANNFQVNIIRSS
jgi:hypothetical protein